MANYINLIGQIKKESDVISGKPGDYKLIWRIEGDETLKKIRATIKQGKAAGVQNPAEWAGNRLRMEGVAGISPAENYI